MLSNTKLGCRIGFDTYNHLIYADDVCLISTSIYSLNKLLQNCETFATPHHLDFNASKTHVQVFLPKWMRSMQGNINITFKGVFLKIDSVVKYLGYEIQCKNSRGDCQLSDYVELHTRIRELYKRAYMLKSKFDLCSPEVKIYLFNTYLSTIYCSSLWTPNKGEEAKIRVAYNDAFRITCGHSRGCSASDMFEQSGVNDFNCLRLKAMSSLQKRLVDTNNSLLYNIYYSETHSGSSFSRILDMLKNTAETIKQGVTIKEA